MKLDSDYLKIKNNKWINLSLFKHIFMMKQLHDITCVFEGLDGAGAIYISGITGAKNISVLQSISSK